MISSQMTSVIRKFNGLSRIKRERVVTVYTRQRACDVVKLCEQDLLHALLVAVLINGKDVHALDTLIGHVEEDCICARPDFTAERAPAEKYEVDFLMAVEPKHIASVLVRTIADDSDPEVYKRCVTALSQEVLHYITMWGYFDAAVTH